MAPRKKRGADQDETGDLLAPAASRQEARAEAVMLEPPRVLEYKPLTSADLWRVERFDELAAEFLGYTDPSVTGGAGQEVSAVKPRAWSQEMAWFHAFASEYTRPWLLVRRLYGVSPLIPDVHAHPDDLKVHTRGELAGAMGLELKQLQEELDTLRTVWQAAQQQKERETGAAGQTGQASDQSAAPGRKAGAELELDDKILARFHFPAKMFDVMMWDPINKTERARSAEENRAERDWFCDRLKQWEKMLSDRMGGAIAREALLNELYLRRLSAEMTVVSPSQTKYKELYNIKRSIEAQYQEQLDKLQKAFPEMAIAGRVSFRAVISDLTLGHRQYYGYKDRRLIDKVFTATELEWMTRTSQQVPVPRYRFGLSVAIVEAIHNLYEPDFRSQFKPAVLKELTNGFNEAVMRMRQAENKPAVDLERGVLPGEGDDFEDFKVPDSQKALEQISVEQAASSAAGEDADSQDGP